MKKSILLFASILAFLSSFSQTVLNQGNMTPHVTFSYRFIRTSYAMPGPDGNAVSHHISSATGFDSTYVIIGSPQFAPHPDSFPGATHTFLQTPDSIYEFMQVDAAGFHKLGELYTNPPGIYPQDDPKTILPFPMQLGASATDSFHSVNHQATFSIFSRGSTHFEGKADGELTTPFGNYTHVVKVHMVESSRDSIVDSQGSFLSTVTTTSDFYYAPGIPFPIVASIVEDAGFFQDSFSVFLIEGTVGAPEMDGFSFSLYPNPTSDQVHILMQNAHGKQVQYALTDLQGRELFQGHHRMDGSGAMTVSLAGLPSGLYLLRLYSNGHWHTETLVRE
jgi:hypothetical protein